MTIPPIPAQAPARGLRAGRSRMRSGPAAAGLVMLAALLSACSSGTQLPSPASSASSTPGVPATAPVAPSPSVAASPAPVFTGPASDLRTFDEVTRITGGLTPKSVVAAPDGHVVAQNMIYTHTVSVYDRKHRLITTIDDRVTPSEFGYSDYTQPVRGGPVEASFSPDGQHVWVSNYSMYGPGFSRPGDDVCSPASKVDRSYLYRISTRSWEIDGIVAVGAVPKFVEASPDGATVLVSNWCTYDLSVVDTATLKEIARVRIGRYPRGIAITADSSKAYVAAMGSSDVKIVDLKGIRAGKRSGTVNRFSSPGRGPRHLNLSPDGRWLYVTLNADGRVAKVDTRTGTVVGRISTGQAPRSSVLSPDGTALFVVNYESSTVSRVRTSDLKVLESRHVDHHPIGITYNPVTQEIWVCSYIGVINVFADQPRSA